MQYLILFNCCPWILRQYIQLYDNRPLGSSVLICGDEILSCQHLQPCLRDISMCSDQFEYLGEFMALSSCVSFLSHAIYAWSACKDTGIYMP